MIQLNQILLQRSGKSLLEDASLTVHPGQKIAIVGQNGCGKSSLFQVILGKLSVDRGDVEVAKQLRIAHMAQEIEAIDRPAREYIIDGFAEYRKVEQRLAQAEAQQDEKSIAQCHDELDAMDAYSLRYKAETIMQGLGFCATDYERKVAEFSGGWRIRLNLARTLLRPSDALLLDEPTNHLDIEAIQFLEQWLKSYIGSVLLVSHDRDFIDATVSHIAHIEDLSIKLYSGSYSDFERQRAERLMLQQQLHEKQQAKKAHLEKYINRFKAQATKAKQAQSRIKALEKMQFVAAVREKSPYQFTIPSAEKISSPLLNWFDVDVGFADKVLLSKSNFSLLPDMRIGLLGKNGAGKSTIIKSIAKELPVLRGEVTDGEHLRIGYFAQHQLEYLDLQASAILHLQRLKPEAREQEIRDFLGSFKIHGDMASEPIAPFSGGEKARLALAILAWLRPNVLLLDEPTNHLDIEMREALADALQAFNGAVILVSHDRYLLRHCVDEFWLVDEGRLQNFDGDLNDYYVFQAKQQLAANQASTDVKQPLVDKKQQRQQAALLRKQLAPLQNAVKTQESAMEKAEAALAVVREQMSDSSLYEAENKAQLQKLLASEAQLSMDIDNIESLWMEAAEALEQAEAALE
jgi:ATP-binding cassette subfamily F protein 3